MLLVASKNYFIDFFIKLNFKIQPKKLRKAYFKDKLLIVLITFPLTCTYAQGQCEIKKFHNYNVCSFNHYLNPNHEQ